MNNETEPDEYYRIKENLSPALSQSEETERIAIIERALTGLNRAELAELIDLLALEQAFLDMLAAAVIEFRKAHFQDQSANGQTSDEPRRILIRGVPSFFPVP